MGKKAKQQSSSIVTPKKTGDSNPFIALAEDTDDKADYLPNTNIIGTTPRTDNNKQQQQSEDSDSNMEEATTKATSKDTDLKKAQLVAILESIKEGYTAI